MAESFRAPGAETGLQGGLLADVAEEVVQDQGTLLNRLHSIYFDWMRLWSASQLEVRPILVLLSSSALRGMNCSSSMVFRIDYDSWFDNH